MNRIHKYEQWNQYALNKQTVRILKVGVICEQRNMRPETLATRGVKLLISSTTFKEALRLSGRS